MKCLLRTGGVVLCGGLLAVGDAAAFGSEAVEEWLQRLRHDDRRARLEAAYAFNAGDDPETWLEHVPGLIDALEDDDAFVRAQAATVLGELRVESDTVVPALIGTLRDEDRTIRSHAAGADARQAAVAVARRLDDPEQTVRKAAAEALDRLKTNSPHRLQGQRNRQAAEGCLRGDRPRGGAARETNAVQHRPAAVDRLSPRLSRYDPGHSTDHVLSQR